MHVIPRLYIYLVAALLLSGVVGYGIHIVRKASRVDAAEARAEAAESGRAADMAEITKRLDRDATQRQALLDRMGGIEERFNNLKIPAPSALVQNHEVPSVEGKCNAPSIGASFVGVWNDSAKPEATRP